MATVSPDLSSLSISQLHELTGRDRRWIKQRLAEGGVDPTAEDGKIRRFPPRAALGAIFDADAISASTERARLDRVRRERAELDLAQARGDLIASGEFTEALLAVTSPIAAALDALPTRAAPELVGLSTIGEIEARLRETVNRLRTDLADHGRTAMGRIERSKQR